MGASLLGTVDGETKPIRSLQEIAVERGAALLDKAEPGWYRHVNTTVLDMNVCTNCIVGQLYENFTFGCRELGIISEDSNIFSIEEIRAVEYYGFGTGSHERHWIKAIAARKESDAADKNGAEANGSDNGLGARPESPRLARTHRRGNAGHAGRTALRYRASVRKLRKGDERYVH